jgi:hypothetical protein
LKRHRLHLRTTTQGADLFLSISKYTTAPASNAATATAAGIVMVLMSNYLFLILLGPSENSGVAAFLRTPWRKTRIVRLFQRLFNKTKSKKPAQADSATPNANGCVGPLRRALSRRRAASRLLW